MTKANNLRRYLLLGLAASAVALSGCSEGLSSANDALPAPSDSDGSLASDENATPTDDPMAETEDTTFPEDGNIDASSDEQSPSTTTSGIDSSDAVAATDAQSDGETAATDDARSDPGTDATENVNPNSNSGGGAGVIDLGTADIGGSSEYSRGSTLTIDTSLDDLNDVGGPTAPVTGLTGR